MSAIGPGDIVQVVRTSHTCALNVLWMVHTVRVVAIRTWNCTCCGHFETTPVMFAEVDRSGAGYPVSWLRKLEPPRLPVAREREVAA